MSHSVTPTIAVTTDVVLLCMHHDVLHILLVQRKYPPFAGQWALPGGFVEATESLADAARRELYEETGVHDIYVEQIAAYGDPQRDPRRHTVSIAFLGLCHTALALTPSDETPRVAWFPLAHLPTPLAFDHAQIVHDARAHLVQAIMVRPLVFQLVDPTFQLSDIHARYQSITQQSLNYELFAEWLLASTGALAPTAQPHLYTHTPDYHSARFFMPWPLWCR